MARVVHVGGECGRKLGGQPASPPRQPGSRAGARRRKNHQPGARGAHLEAALGVVPRHVAHVVGHPHHVGGIQGGIHLIQHEEGGGLEAARRRLQSRQEAGRGPGSGAVSRN